MDRTILIVDDSKTERVVLKGFLKSEYDLIEAASGEEAIEILQTRSKMISAIVLDVIMPGMDGFETLKVIKANPLWLPIPVVITTGLDDDASREKAIACGADNFVTKPFNQRVLMHIVQNVIKLRETAALANTLYRDNMTGLLNRESFYTEAARMINRQPSGFFVLSSLDIENFKVVNDQHGTEVGDEVLKHIASALNTFAAGNGGLACRYMGDRFAVLFPARLLETGEAAECHRLMTAPACLTRPVRIRVGRYEVTQRELPVSAMYDRASMAESTIRGRIDVYHANYTEKMRDELLREQEIVNDMGAALHNGEFEPWFQPQYNHATGALVGAEALVRWRKNEKIIPPDSFIPVFERNGFIYEVDQCIWRQVCRYLRSWLDAGKTPMPISVNISRYDLYQPDFMDIISGLVKEYDLPIDLLRLEITESAFSDSTSIITDMAEKLIAQGFTVEIDDFGSGYSSLNTLKDVPATILKLDMRFFEATNNSERGGNIVESVVRMAKWLGMTIIAEGVEYKAQADYLKSIGCYYIQGYFYSRPIPAADYEKLLEGREKEHKLSQLVTLETLDNNEFWNPRSMETLIFNSYVGGACIFEFADGKTELLRVNDQYVTELHGIIPQGAQLKDCSLFSFFSDESKKDLIQMLEAASEQGREASCETRLTKGDQTEYIRFTTRVIARADERLLYYGVLVNMTEQVESERKRMESAEQLQIIMSNINGSVSAFLLDDAGNTRLIFGNDKYYEIFGYTKEQAEKEHLDVISCIAPEDFDAVIEKLRQLKSDGIPIDIDYRAVTRDGRLIYVRSVCSRMSMEGYGDEVIVSVKTDITEQRTLQDQLSAVVENINGGVSAVCLNGGALEYIFVNDKYFDIIGYTREEFAAEVTDVFDIIHPEDRERVEKLVREAAETEKAFTMEYRIIRRNGAVRHVLCTTNMMRLFGVEQPVQLAVTNDVTVLREAQQKERDLSVQMQTIMENIHGGITATVYHDKDDVEVVFSNDGFYELYGYTKEQLENELPNMLDLIIPEDRERTMDTVARIVEERGSDTYEYRCRKRDGSLMWTQVTNAVISLAGVGDTVLLAIVTDVTALRLAQKQSAEAMDRLKAVMNAMTNGVTAVTVHGDHTKFLFANERYYEMHGITKEEYEQNVLSDSLALVYPDDREMLRDLVLGTTELGQTGTAEYRILLADGSVRWAKAAISVTSISGVDAPVQVTIFTDIDAEKKAEQQRGFLNSAAGVILAQPEIETAINETLQRINDYFHADRTYVVELDEAKRVTRNTYEFCAEGVSPQKANLQEMAFMPSDSWFETLSHSDYMVIDDVDAMADSEAQLRDVLLKQDIHSIIIVALKRDGRLIGFAGADNPSSAVEQVSELTALAVYIAVLLTRRDLKRSYDHERKSTHLLMEDTPGGFCRMAITRDKSPALANVNGGFCRMLDMTEDEVFAAYGEDIHGCLNTEDFADFPADIADAAKNGGQFSTKCRLHKKDGSFLWVMVFGRFVRDENGETFLNAYFTDITAEKTAEQYQIELLDNLTTGAALYEYDGKELKVIHINRRYWKLVEREPVEYGKASVFSAIHPDDRAMIRQELESAIRQTRNAEADCRLLCGRDSYKPFHISASITPKDGGYMLCASYMPISDETMSVQEMLPIALSTMVASTDDMSYVKDKNLRYICVSRSVAAMAGVDNPRDFIGRTAEEMFDEAFAEKFNADDRHVIETGETVMHALERIPAVGGGMCLARTSKFPILDRHGSAVGVYCISHDITAQKERESQLELLSASIPGGLAAYSISGDGFKTLYFNDGYFAYSGYTREEYRALTEKEPLALMFDEDKPKLLETVHDFAAKKKDGMTGSCTYRVRTRSGGMRWMSMKAVLSQVGEDAFIFNAIQLDITDQIDAENRRARLLDNIPGGIATFHCTQDGVRLAYFNDGYARLFGYTRREYLEQVVGEALDFIEPSDRPLVDGQLSRFMAAGTPVDCIFRVRCKGGAQKWVNCQAALSERIGDTAVANVVLTDVSEAQKEKERLRLAEEEYRIAIAHAGRTICRYSIAEQTLAMSADVAARFALSECLTGVPYERVKLGKISSESADAYIAFFESIMHGEKECSATFCKLLNGDWRWIDAHGTTIFDDGGKPVSAIISYTDVTEQREKEAVYSRWQNSIAERRTDSYTLFRCNLSKSSSYESWEGDLLRLYFKEGKQTFDERTDEFVTQCVYAEDRERYRSFMRADTMLAEYYRGHRSDSIEFRQQMENGAIRWLRLSVDLMEYKNSRDVEAYLMYENIDDRKRSELKTIERAETDPLTGVLNRATFAIRVNQLISSSTPGTFHALMVLDIDSFKQVNDVFGHGAGDQALINIADLLTRSSRRDDLVGRLGGDEFLMFLTDIQNEAAAAAKARQLCELVRRDFSVSVRISASIGISLYPTDGEGFEALYKTADAMLYRVKDSGKNGYAVTRGEMVLDADSERQPAQINGSLSKTRNLRRILIVDDSKMDLEILSALFRGEYRIEKAEDGATALAKLRHYGAAISVVLLDLMMPGMDGFEVLQKMQREESLRTIPVIVVSADEQRETALRVIRAGASDLVAKPVDPDLLHIRVESAISRSENDRLRAQNSFLSMRNAEVNSYKSAMERSGILVITLDWARNEFTYSPSVSAVLAGEFDGRRLWRVLLSNMIADTHTVQQMQHLVHEIAEDRSRTDGNMTVRLKTKEGVSKLFEMNVFKEMNDLGIADKLLLTLRRIQPQADGGERK